MTIGHETNETLQRLETLFANGSLSGLVQRQVVVPQAAIAYAPYAVII